MVDRFLVWLGACVVTAGMAAAMVAGAGVASADKPSGSDTKGTTSSESAKPTGNKADSHKDGAGAPKQKPSGDKPKKDAPADPKDADKADKTDASNQDEEDKSADKTDPPAQQPDDESASATIKDTKPAGSDAANKLTDQSVKPTAHAHKPAAKPAPEQQADEPTPQETTESEKTTDTTEAMETVQESASATVVPMSRNAKAAATVEAATVEDAAHAHKPAAKPAPEQQADEPTPQETTESEKTTDTTEAMETVQESASASVVPMSRNAKAAATVEAATVEDAAAPETAAVAFAAPANAEITSTATAPPLPALLSAIGTVVFNLYGLATRLVGGPPILPPNSTVTVHSSTLRIDCADGSEVPADWYVPDTPEPPTRLIHLQHGFLTSGPWFSHTAATLAEQTNSIVVAPTITSNFLSCDACWLLGPADAAGGRGSVRGRQHGARRQRAGGRLHRPDPGPGRAGRARALRWWSGRGHGRRHGRQQHRRQARRCRHARRRVAGRLDDDGITEEGARQYSDLPTRRAEVFLERVRRRQRCAARGAARSVHRGHVGRRLT